MPFAIELFLAAADAGVRKAWHMLAATGLVASMDESNARPHITLAVCERLEVAAAVPRLEACAAGLSPLSVCFSGVNAFRTDPAAVYLAPDSSPELMAANHRGHEALAEVAGHFWRYYLPGLWTPHCTLAEGVAQEQVPRVIEASQDLGLALEARIWEMGLVQFRPVRYLRSLRLGAQP